MVFSQQADSSNVRTRQPAVPVAVCFAVGIVLDRFVLHLTWWSWTIIACLAVGLAMWGLRQSKTRWVVLGLLAGGVCLGGMRHHAFWSLHSVEDVSQFITLESRLIRLRGRVESAPIVKVRSSKPFQAAFEQPDTTILTLDCESLQDGTPFVPVQGKVQVRIRGAVPDLKVADAVEVFGWASRPNPPANPDDFAFGDYLKQQQIRGIVQVGQPEAVTKIPTVDPASWSRRVDDLRTKAEQILHRHLSEQNANIAAALLLGIRSELPEDVRLSFAQSGMMHVLALSGLHVGILAMLVWLVGRLLRFSPGTVTVLMLLAALSLAVVSGGRPPIVRATVFLGIVALGRLASRHSHPLNILGLSVLVILAWNPTDLFDVGTQLSFLAVMGILMTARWTVPHFGYSYELAVDESQMENHFSGFAFLIRGVLWRYWCLMLGIWLLTGPLIAARFHLISPIGIVLNSLLIPLVTLVLWLGYLLLLVGGLLPGLAGIIAGPLDWGLTGLLSVVEWGADVRLGHFDVAGPPDWWLAGYYLLLAAVCLFRFRLSRPRFTGAVGILVWTIVGLAVMGGPTSPRGLRCTFLSVGHGSAILVEFPNGKTLLYDAGALDDGERAFRVIRTELWRRGITRLDAIALSHPDLDHVNAIPEIAENIPIGSVLVAKPFLQSKREIVPYLIEKLAEQNIPIRSIGRDDRLALDEFVSVEVLHPEPLANYAHSNATSLVVRFTHANRSLLLMGDVEREGLTDLMAHHRGAADVFQSPHHGSRTANTPELARWANPSIVVVSGGHVPGRLQELKTLYGSSTRLLSTHNHGAVTVEITHQGHLLVETTREL